ncbi:MAG: molybdate ABC transporter substrate-binding protein [Pseudomonadota bacterium]
MQNLVLILVLSGVVGFCQPAVAATARVAVASNFLAPARALAAEFTRLYGDTVALSAGSTGMLYTQIINGAPFDILLAANVDEPRRLEQQGLGVAGTRFTYAIGTLVLWTTTHARDLDGDGAEILRARRGLTLAIANPKTAPYGAAAHAVLRALGINSTQWRIIQGENISQTYQYVATGNAQFGFVALAQLREAGIRDGYWRVPSDLYPPLRQQAILLKRAEKNSVARHWLEFLRTPEVRKKISENYGYSSEE